MKRKEIKERKKSMKKMRQRRMKEGLLPRKKHENKRSSSKQK
jgi:hypothetical protein